MNVAVPRHGFTTFEVDESNDAWFSLKRWIVKWRAVDSVTTLFSNEERTTARWLELEPEWHHGYPQPEEDFGYLSVTYDLTEYCASCGLGTKQRAPFRMRSEPKWGRRGILQLNWVFDEYFVTLEVWETVFKPYDILCRPVENGKGATLKRVVQLVSEAGVDVLTEGLAAAECASCSRVKYLPVARGPFPPLVAEPAGHLVKTRQDFGSGARAYKAVIISQELYGILLKKNVRGISARPVAEHRT